MTQEWTPENSICLNCEHREKVNMVGQTCGLTSGGGAFTMIALTDRCEDFKPASRFGKQS